MESEERHPRVYSRSSAEPPNDIYALHDPDDRYLIPYLHRSTNPGEHDLWAWIESLDQPVLTPEALPWEAAIACLPLGQSLIEVIEKY